MDSERFRHLQKLIGYDNERMAKMLNIDLADVEDFSAGRKPVPEKLASELEFFADWAAEVGDTAVKRDLARRHLGD
jgi:hypothetical protein